MVRRNSWTSSSKVDSSPKRSSVNAAFKAALDLKLPKLNLSSLTPGSSKSNKPEKKRESRPTDSKRKKSSQPRQRTTSEIIAGLKKSLDIRSTMAELTKAPEINRDELTRVQQELSEALEKIMKLTEEQESHRDSVTKANVEVTELKMMLAESAKENNELENRLSEHLKSTSDSKVEVEALKAEIEDMKEHNHALATNLNRSDEKIKSLIAEMKIMEGNPPAGATDERMSELFELKQAIDDKQQAIDGQTKQIQERDSKIEALERQLVEGSSGDEAQKVIDLTTELESMRKKHKSEQLDSSVQLAKKDAMVAKVQDQLDEAMEQIDEEKEIQASLREEVENTKERLREALETIEESKSLQVTIDELQKRVEDAETVEKGLQDAIDKWTDKTFEWKEKALAYEQELEKLRGDKPNDTESGFFGMFGATS